MAATAVLPSARRTGTIIRVEDAEATRLILEALFDIRAKVTDLHEDVFGPEDDDEEEEEEDS